MRSGINTRENHYRITLMIGGKMVANTKFTYLDIAETTFNNIVKIGGQHHIKLVEYKDGLRITLKEVSN